jgi:hypothetical protein
MPRHEAGAAVAGGAFRASMAPAGVLASALSFHQSSGGVAHRTRRTNSSKKRDSFTAVTDESAAESSWHSVDGSVGGGGTDGLLHMPELLFTGSQLEKRVGLQILHKKVSGDGMFVRDAMQGLT